LVFKSTGEIVMRQAGDLKSTGMRPVRNGLQIIETILEIFASFKIGVNQWEAVLLEHEKELIKRNPQNAIGMYQTSVSIRIQQKKNSERKLKYRLKNFVKNHKPEMVIMIGPFYNSANVRWLSSGLTIGDKKFPLTGDDLPLKGDLKLLVELLKVKVPELSCCA